MITISSRLLEERSSRVQEALLITGLNEVVWYSSWLFIIIIRSLILAVLSSIITSIFIIEKTGLLVIMMAVIM